MKAAKDALAQVVKNEDVRMRIGQALSEHLQSAPGESIDWCDSREIDTVIDIVFNNMQEQPTEHMTTEKIDSSKIIPAHRQTSVRTNYALTEALHAMELARTSHPLAMNATPPGDEWTKRSVDAALKAACKQVREAIAGHPAEERLRGRKIGGKYQATGFIVSLFQTTAGDERCVFEFDYPAGMLHVFTTEQVEMGYDIPVELPNSAAVAAIQYALEHCDGADDIELFLKYWNYGEFDIIRRDWENVPDAVFIGADTLFKPTKG